jgi:hypothetical protein
MIHLSDMPTTHPTALFQVPRLGVCAHSFEIQGGTGYCNRAYSALAWL